MKKPLFVTSVISQGSAATRLRCDGHDNSHFVKNFLEGFNSKKFWKIRQYLLKLMAEV